MAFNWPKLVGGAAVALGSGAGAAGLVVSWPVRLALLAIALGCVYLVSASLAVSWWVYDHSDLHSWVWLRPAWPAGLPRWALVHAGFDEAGPALPAVLGAPDAVIDISSGLAGTARSLRRAQRNGAATATATAATLASGCPQLPLRCGGLDVIVLVFAAHEVRDPSQRVALFCEFRRALRPGGRVVLVEHLRDRPNMAAFGPGAWHFQTRRTWIGAASDSGFAMFDDVRQGRFVRALVLCRP